MPKEPLGGRHHVNVREHRKAIENANPIVTYRNSVSTDFRELKKSSAKIG